MTEEQAEELKNSMKVDFEEMKASIKNDFEDLKEQMKADLEKFGKEVFDHDHYQKKIKFLEQENARLKGNKPEKLNEESFHTVDSYVMLPS